MSERARTILLDSFPKLLGYARELGVEGKIRNYVRVLL